MKNKLLKMSVLFALILLVGSSTVFATETVSNTNNTQTSKITAFITKGDNAIASRIKSLNSLSTRIGKMKNLTTDQKALNTKTINDAITAMNTAKTKLDADTDLAQAKLDYTSIFNDNRIYMVVEPQVTVSAYADNALSVIPSLNTAMTNIQTRITKAQTASKDINAIQTQYTDAQTKIADASTQATNAITAAGKLAIDHGDKTIIASNKTINATIKTTKSALNGDIKAVRADIVSMKKALKALGF
jgi:hypothetical protein